jgi:hypothetical protein
VVLFLFVFFFYGPLGTDSFRLRGIGSKIGLCALLGEKRTVEVDGGVAAEEERRDK